MILLIVVMVGKIVFGVVEIDDICRVMREIE